MPSIHHSDTQAREDIASKVKELEAVRSSKMEGDEALLAKEQDNVKVSIWIRYTWCICRSVPEFKDRLCSFFSIQVVLVCVCVCVFFLSECYFIENENHVAHFFYPFRVG